MRLARRASEGAKTARQQFLGAQNGPGDPLIDPRGLLGLRQQTAVFFAKLLRSFTRRAPAHCGKSRPAVRSGVGALSQLMPGC